MKKDTVRESIHTHIHSFKIHNISTKWRGRSQNQIHGMPSKKATKVKLEGEVQLNCGHPKKPFYLANK